MKMVQRLQDIMSSLYKPPADGVRQAFALPRAEAEKLPLLPTIAIISITAPERPPATLGDFFCVLRLCFADVDFLNPDLSARARGKLHQAFTREHSNAIRSFVEGLPNEIRTVVIHCEGGYSRSCAVALALHQLYGYHVAQYLGDANESIVRVMSSTNLTGRR